MAHKRVAIVQSSYIPWKGYFDLIRAADEFILLDDVQFTKRDWRSRNRIKTKDGLLLADRSGRTRKGATSSGSCDTMISDPSWGHEHWQTIRSAYARTPYLRRLRAGVRDVLSIASLGSSQRRQSRAHRGRVLPALGITTPITWSYRIPSARRTQRAADRPVREGAARPTYLSGPSARGYLDERAFARGRHQRCTSRTTTATRSIPSRTRHSSTPCRRSTCCSAPVRARSTT